MSRVTRVSDTTTGSPAFVRREQPSFDLFGIDDFAGQIEAAKSPADVLTAYLRVSLAEVDDSVAEARAVSDPDNELPGLAVRRAAAATDEDGDGPGRMTPDDHRLQSP